MAKDTGNTVQDANVMLALYNPNRDSLKSYKKYNIQYLENSFRSLMVLKNRFGDCDVEIGLNFFGAINYFKELPKPEDIYDYEKYKTPDYILNKEEDETKVEETDQPKEHFKFVL